MAKRLLLIFGLLLLVLAGGSAGYMTVEGWSFFDSVYMTVISLTTVGYGEIPRELSAKGRIFTMFLLIGGVGTLAYGLSTTTAFLVEGRLSDILRKRKMEGRIEKLRGHCVVCGLGDTGRHVAKEFLKTGTPFVAIDRDRATLEVRQAELGEILFVEGDATQEASLRRANVQTARGLVSALPEDKDNIFVVLSAREINPTLRIIARVTSQEVESKLRKVGADGTVCATSIGGLRIASEMVRPTVVSFLDTMLRDPRRTIRVEEAPVGTGSSLIGQSLREAALPKRIGLLVIAARDSGNEHYIYNPPANYLIKADDVLIVMGDSGQLESLRRLARGGE